MRIWLILLVGSLVLFSGALRAQTRDSLHTAIITNEGSLKKTEQNYQRLKQTLDQLNRSIFRQKKASRSSYNPLLWLKLYHNLKSASSLAAEMETTLLNKRQIQLELKRDYRLMITSTDSLITVKMRELHRPQEQPVNRAILKKINQLETAKSNWQNKLLELTPAETSLPKLTLEPGDDIERIRLKMELVQDYTQKVHTELKGLQDQREKLQADLQIYREMVNFAENLQQISDPEQEYFNQERIDHLRDEVRNTKLEISEIEERISLLTKEEIRLIKTRQDFSKQLEIKLKK